MIVAGSRVKLRQEQNWLSRFEALARNGRVGTVSQVHAHQRADVEFDVVRHGAQPITGRFMTSDLMEVNSPKMEQAELLPTPASAERSE